MRCLLLPFLLCAAALPVLRAQSASNSSPPLTLRLTFLGDIMAHDVNFRMNDYRDIYRGVEDILLGDDLTVGNLEFPIDPTLPAAGYPAFNANLAYVQAAIAEGIDAFSVANNHSFDGREEGIFQTLRSIAALHDGADRPVLFSGIRGNRDAPFLPETVVVGGIRIGFVAVTQFLNIPQGDGYVNVVDYENRDSAARFLSFVREASLPYDLFIVSFHGDREFVQEPSAGKREFFRRIIENGATIVYGHHPHVVQCYERVRVGECDRLILHSMGNFVSGMTWRLEPAVPSAIPAAAGESYLLSVEVRCASGGASVIRVEPVPIANYRNGRGEMVVAKLKDLGGGSLKIPAAWSAYYAGRLTLMEDFFSRCALGAGTKGEGVVPSGPTDSSRSAPAP